MLIAIASAAIGCNALTGVSDLEPVACVGAACDAALQGGDANGETSVLDAASDATGETTVDAATDAVDADAFDAAVCANGAKDPVEADVDCGGACPTKCAEGKTCAVDGDCATGRCASGKCAPCATGMVVVPTSKLGRACIDAHEVTNAEYQAFLATSPSTAGQPLVCGWNTSFAPSSGWPAPASAANRPVRFVDWCDATAYCKAAGKRLCGKVGGGPVSVLLVTDPAEDEWMRACTSLGTRAYPYGSVYDADKCNGNLAGAGTVVDVGSLTGCVTAQGAFDMAGNAAEWEDACSGSSGATDKCRARGGSFVTTEPRCNTVESFDRQTGSDRIGFRCCDDAPSAALGDAGPTPE